MVELLQVLQRFTTLETKRVTPSVEGIKGVEGYEAGFTVATFLLDKTFNGVETTRCRSSVVKTSCRTPSGGCNLKSKFLRHQFPRYRLFVLQGSQAYTVF